jgi:hypothetical protein
LVTSSVVMIFLLPIVATILDSLAKQLKEKRKIIKYTTFEICI